MADTKKSSKFSNLSVVLIVAIVVFCGYILFMYI